MKPKDIFLFIVVLSGISLIASCRQVKETTTAGKSAIQSDTAIAKEPLAGQSINRNAETVYFKASGTEPFWGLEISGENFRFTSLIEGFEKYNATHTEPIRAMDANVKMYRSLTEQGEMKIQIVQQICTDAMSGKENRYEVSVELKRGIDKNFKLFKGCGSYITDYCLHDIWTLEELNGQPIDVQQYGKDRPRIEINSTQNTFMGVSGNNEINGKIFFEKGLLRFTDIGGLTNATAAENDFIRNLQSVTNYSLENNQLVLFNPSVQLLQFRKTD